MAKPWIESVRGPDRAAILKKTLFIKTYGCQMNVYDSARMADVLAPLGYEMAERAENADLIILNTCHIREKAAEKVYSELGRLHARHNAKRPILAVAGCVAQAEGEEIIRRAPYVDIVFGPQSYHRLPEMVAQAERNPNNHRDRIINIDFPEEAKFDHLPPPGKRGASAFISVQEGCDKFCSFCVVPYTRGAEYSRPAADILAEARTLITQGSREIILLGQNVNAYHGASPQGGEWGLGRLIRALAEIDGLERIRYTTSHPSDMDDDLITAHAEIPQLMPFLHLPVQSGSDKILDAMNRRYRVDDYYAIIDRLRHVRDDLALSSDFIVAFPGETDQDFADTLSLVEKIGFAQAYSFKYSPRPGTPGAAMDHPVDAAIADERLARLQDLLNQQQRAFNHRFLGRDMMVLFDHNGRQTGQIAGRTPHMQSVHVQAPESILGTISRVRIEAAGAHCLAATLVTEPATTTQQQGSF